MDTPDAPSSDQQTNSVDSDLLLWWEDFYIPVFEYMLPKMGNLDGKSVLELGTGTGGTATLLAKRGASVTGIDLLPFRIDEAKIRAKQHNVDESIEFALMDAMHLAFPENTFDFIISKSVLVFTDHSLAAKECYRVLKPGGKAIFMENMRYHPLVWLYRKLFIKYSAGLHYFSKHDIDSVGSHFEDMEHAEFHFSSVKSLFWKKILPISFLYRLSFGFLKVLDSILIKIFPFLKRFCWITAIVCYKK
ncbi:class I SAM-dependent methyltransferase [Candidatus Poribacteria bacterium]|nr:class I SAM-dependent methyltransferase [Candidatus Poribacteria bacterium]